MNAHGNPNRRPSTVSEAPALALPLALLLAGCSPSGERALIEGDRLLQSGKAGEAIPLLERAVRDLPQNAPAFNHLGLAYHATGRTNEARRAYLRALEVDRNRVEATYNLAITHLERGEALEAERGLRAYLVAHPGDAAVLETLGRLQFQSGRWDDAERSFAAIQPAEAISADGWNTRGLLSLRKRRFKDAVNCFQYALRLDPGTTTPLYNLGVTHQLQGDRRSAAAHYRSWLAANPGAAQGPAVQELIRQWEAPTPPAGTPGATVGTNAAPAGATAPGGPRASRTNPAPGPRTNAVAEVARPPANTPAPPNKAGEANAPTASPAVAKPAAPPQITPPPPPPLQVVAVQEDPPLKPAQDEPAAKPPTQPSTPSPAAAAVPNPAPVQAAIKPAQTATTPPANPATTSQANANARNPAPEAPEATAPAKRSLWQRVTPGKWANPVQWFRKEADTNTPPTAPAPATPPVGKPATAKKSTPLSAPTAVPPAVSPAAPATGPGPAPAAGRPAPRSEIASPRRPAPPRYTRRAVGLLPAGNRAAAEPHFQQGVGAQQRRDLATAAAEYRRATELDPAFHEAYHNLALVAMDQGDLDLALLACEQALLIRPSDAETRRNFASALKVARYPQDAVEQIELFLTSKPADTALHLAAAGLYAGELDDVAKARTHYESVLALEPSHPQAAAIRGWLASHPR